MDANSGEPWSEMDIADLFARSSNGGLIVTSSSLVLQDISGPLCHAPSHEKA